MLICLLREGASARQGGSLDILEDARKRGWPLLEIRLGVGPGGEPVFREAWRDRENFSSESPPELVDLNVDLPDWADVQALCRPLRDLANRQANWLQALFGACAAGDAAYAPADDARRLLRSRPTEACCRGCWPSSSSFSPPVSACIISCITRRRRERGTARLVAEVGDSISAMMGVAGRLSYLFQLPMPPTLSPLLETLNVAHMHMPNSASLCLASAPRRVRHCPVRRSQAWPDRLLLRFALAPEGICARRVSHFSSAPPARSWRSAMLVGDVRQDRER